jgi:hypothetical protein
MPIRSIEGLFFCNKNPVEEWTIGRLIVRDSMKDLETNYDGEFVKFK